MTAIFIIITARDFGEDKILRDMARFAGMGYGTLENDSGPLGKVLYAPPVTPDIGGPMGFIQESDV